MLEKNGLQGRGLLAIAAQKRWPRFLLWCVLSLLLISYFIFLLLGRSPINSNIMDLIPASHIKPTVEQSINRFSNRMGSKVIFLISNVNKQAAQKSADIFYQKLSQSRHVFSQVHYHLSGAEQQAWAGFYFPYRLSLLAPSDDHLLEQNHAKQVVQTALLNVFSPMGIVNSEVLQTDPFFLFQHFITSLPKPASHLTVVDQRLMVHEKGVWYVMIRGDLKGQSFSMVDQKAALTSIGHAEQAVRKAVPSSHILKTGMLFYASAGAQSAKGDISTIGIGSLIGIVLLMLLTFRSLSPLVFTLLSTAMGCVAAFSVTVFLFGTVYLFTLIFGASLIGIAVDYAFFYYADQLRGGANWTPELGLSNILPGISLGLLNVVLAYLILFFTPFPALKQLTVFAISGLTMAFLTVVCVFPLLLRAKAKAFVPPLLRLVRWYFHGFMKLNKKTILAIVATVMFVALGGLLQLHSNDDIRILETIPVHLKQQETQIKKVIGSHMGMNYYVVTAKMPEMVLQREAALTKVLGHDFAAVAPAYMAISSYLPSQALQRHNFQAQKKLIQSQLLPYLSKIGMKPIKSEPIQQKLLSLQFNPLTISKWLHSPVSRSLRFLWLGKVKGDYAAVVLLSNQLASSKLKTIAKNSSGVTYVNKALDISHAFARYRYSMSYLLGCVYVVLWVFLFLRYGLRNAFIYCLPPICSSLLCLAVLGYFSIPLTLFNVLGLILVLGIGVDYVLFFAETRSTYLTTMLAISLSAITTVLSFGLLAFSATPVIHYFGVLVFVGITSSFLLSPLAVCLQKGEQHE